MSDSFEKQLAQVPLRELPRQWRSEILGAAVARTSGPTPVPRRVVGIWEGLWLRLPIPTLGFGAAWALMVCLAFDGTAPQKATPPAERAQPMHGLAMAMAQRQAMLQAFHALEGADDPESPSPIPSAQRPSPTLPRPRSDWDDPHGDRLGWRRFDSVRELI